VDRLHLSFVQGKSRRLYPQASTRAELNKPLPVGRDEQLLPI